jgi:glycosyltransferase involved in cell wall biosynthesis
VWNKRSNDVKVHLVISNATISPQLFEIIRSLKETKVIARVTIVAEENNPLMRQIVLLGIKCDVITIQSRRQILQKSFYMLRVLLRDRPQTLLASGQYATFIALPASFLLRVTKRVYIRHHSNFHHKYRMQAGVFLDRVMNFMSTEIIAVSNVVKDILISKENVEKDKVSVIHNGIDLNKFQNQSQTPRRIEGVFRVGVISRLTEWKGVKFTAIAFSKFAANHPNSVIHIIGADGGEKSQIHELLKSLPDANYVFEDINFDIASFLRSIDVLVHVPLNFDDEAFGIVYLEALATGTPAIFTISGILNELDHPEKYCSVVSPSNALAIQEALESHYYQMPKFNVLPDQWLAQFSLERQGQAYMRVLNP